MHCGIVFVLTNF